MNGRRAVLTGLSLAGAAGLAYLLQPPREEPLPDGPREWRQRGQFFKWKEHQIFYLDEGEGPTLVCLHGFPTSSYDWNAIWPDLVSRYRVLALDFLGFGFSSKPYEHEYSVFEQADIVESLLAELGVGDYHLLAHDYGDTVALELLARKHEGLKALCMLNGGIFVHVYQPRPIQKLLAGPAGPGLAKAIKRPIYAKNLARVFGAKTKPSKREMDDYWAITSCNQGTRISHLLLRYIEERNQNQESWTQAMVEQDTPLRLIVGLEDPVSGENIADAFREIVPDPDLVLLECGHYPQVELPETTSDAILEFFEKN